MSELISLFRYVRPLVLDLDRFEIITRPTGGITFYFQIDQEFEMLSYVPVICRDDDNFNFKISRNIALGRFNKGQYTTFEYRRGLSLVDNVVDWLSTGTFNDNTSITLKDRLNSIITNNTEAVELHDHIVNIVSAKHVDTLSEFDGAIGGTIEGELEEMLQPDPNISVFGGKTLYMDDDIE